MKDQKFADYIQHILYTIGADFAQQEERIRTQLKEIADKGKALGESSQFYKRTLFYPISSQAQAEESKAATTAVQRVPGGAVVPEGFKHYPQCSCYRPDERHPRPPMELAEIDILSEKEAREELK